MEEFYSWQKLHRILDSTLMTSDRHEFDPDEFRKDINGVRPIELWNELQPRLTQTGKHLYCIGDTGNVVTKRYLVWKATQDPDLVHYVPGNHDYLIHCKRLGYTERDYVAFIPEGVYAEHGDIVDPFWSRDEKWTKTKALRLVLGNGIIRVSDVFERVDVMSDERAISLVTFLHDKIVPRGLRLNGTKYDDRAKDLSAVHPWIKVYVHGHDHRAAYRRLQDGLIRVDLNSWMHSKEDGPSDWHRKGEVAPYLFGVDTWNLYKVTKDGLVTVVQGDRQ